MSARGSVALYAVCGAWTQVLAAKSWAGMWGAGVCWLVHCWGSDAACRQGRTHSMAHHTSGAATSRGVLPSLLRASMGAPACTSATAAAAMP